MKKKLGLPRKKKRKKQMKKYSIEHRLMKILQDLEFKWEIQLKLLRNGSHHCRKKISLLLD